MNIPRSDVGVVVGRFQVNRLHAAHTDLIDTILNNHKKVIIILGVSPAKTTFNNPLDFAARKGMIEEYLGKRKNNVLILPIKDIVSDEQWSKNLDEIISDVVGPRQSITLYGSRDSFIKHYTGRFDTQELVSTNHISGTQIRNEVGNTVQASEDFRAGAIWAAYNQFPRVITTVDVAIVKGKEILLVRKPTESKFRFCGGFADVDSSSFEADARREVSEETGLEVEVEYVGSALIDDWRYRAETDKIKTIFFLGRFIFGSPRPNDDVSETRWFKLEDIKKNLIVPEHAPLLDMVFAYLEKGKGK